jgi:type IV pilus assembly protein PilE
MQKHGKAGFTLIEMMVVIVIIGVLSLIAYPSYLENIRKTKRVEVKVTLVDIAAKMQHYQVVHHRFLKKDNNPINLGDLNFKTNASNQLEIPEYDPVYLIEMLDVKEKSWTLVAYPIQGTIMQHDGEFRINELNERCWQKGMSCQPSQTSNWEGK